MKTIVASLCLDGSMAQSNRYKFRSKILIDSTMRYTNFDVLIVTDEPDYYEEYNDNPRVFIEDFVTNFPDDKTMIGGMFNFNLKRCPIKLAYQKDYDVVFYQDCDGFFSGWDQESYEDMLNSEYEIFYATFYPHHTVNDQLSKPHNHPSTGPRVEAMGDLIYPDLLDAVLAVETKMIYKNSSKMKDLIDIWDKFSYKCQELNLAVVPESLFFCMAGRHAKMEPIGVERNHPIGKLCNTIHGCWIEKKNGIEDPVKMLDYFGLLERRFKSEEDLRLFLNI
jgi:hypothetical protein